MTRSRLTDGTPRVTKQGRATSEVIIEYAGEPVAQGRPRLGRHGVYTPARTAQFETALGWCARLAMRNRPLLEGALKVDVVATFTHAPTCRPDGDNILKSVCDALEGVVFANDAAVVDAHITKTQGPHPHLRIEVNQHTGGDNVTFSRTPSCEDEA